MIHDLFHQLSLDPIVEKELQLIFVLEEVVTILFFPQIFDIDDKTKLIYRCLETM